MNIENIENPENQEEIPETSEKTFAERIIESVDFVVDMMNSGKVNPIDVYPPNRYHGD
jgi:hypothetical protein